MMNEKAIEILQERYKKLALKLSAIGPIVQGTITKRIISRDVKAKGKKKRTYGPYYQWTFKEAGKTVTVNLTSQQVKSFSNAILNNRKVEALLAQMRNLSRRICEASAEGVKKRMRINDDTNP
jgi:hypothetical protein